MREKLRIGTFTFDSPAFLAPMAGVSDLPFRQLCREFGAGLATSEMVTSDSRFWQSSKSASRLAWDSHDTGPRSIQIAGSEPSQMADAAKACVDLGADIIDINMGCPVKKVCKKLAGSALLKDEVLVGRILEAVCSAIDAPVTLKTRTGWSPQQRNGPTVARIAQDSGIAAIAIHGRTRECRFEGQAEYDTIAEIVSSVSIPVLANGDISSAQQAARVIETTGASGILVGRAALGRPWIFREIKHHLATGRELKAPGLDEIKRVLIDHLKAIHRFYGETKGVQLARKHFSWYCQEFKAFDDNKKQFNTLVSAEAQLKLTLDYFNLLHSIEDKAA
jgi:tRNA-dihydrouridine synthase B